LCAIHRFSMCHPLYFMYPFEVISKVVKIQNRHKIDFIDSNLYLYIKTIEFIRKSTPIYILNFQLNSEIESELILDRMVEIQKWAKYM
jgi:hypothetical protein